MSAVLMVSKITRIIELLSLLEISNKKLLSTFSPWVYKKHGSKLSLMNVQRVYNICFSIQPAFLHNEERWSVGIVKHPGDNLQLQVLWEEKKMNQILFTEEISGWKLVGFENTFHIVNTKINSPLVLNKNEISLSCLKGTFDLKHTFSAGGATRGKVE